MAKANNGFMQGRGADPDGLDDFPTPPWATRALLWRLVGSYALGSAIAREPCANRGWMVKPLREFFPVVLASDLADYSAPAERGGPYSVKDYMSGDEITVDWTITNPPYKFATEFIERALDHSTVGVAMILRGAFIEGQTRFTRLFKARPPHILHFAERVPMFRGRVGSPKETSPAVYSWFLWEKGKPALGIGSGTWELIPPGTRDALRVPGDW